MSTEILYFFSCISPYAYLGHSKFCDMAQRRGVKIHYKPAMIGKIFEHSGAVPLPQRPIPRQHYRLVELQRWREKLNIELNLKPKFFPTDPGLADRIALALTAENIDPAHYILRAMQACWVKEQDIAEADVLKAILDDLGHDSARIITQAQSANITAQYEQNSQEAVQYEIVGMPCYRYKDENFWGQDRIDMLDEMIESGRAAFHPV